MHIAILNPQANFDANDSYWTEHPDFGGQLVYVKEVAVAMATQGHQIDILTRQIIDPAWPEFSATLDHYKGIRGVNIVRIPCGPNKFLPKEQLWPHLCSTWVPNILNFYLGTGTLPDAFAAQYGDGGVAAAMLALKTGRPFTFTAHSLSAQRMDKLGSSLEYLSELEDRYHFSRQIMAEKISMKYAGCVITSTRQERMEQYGHKAYQEAVDPSDSAHFAVVPPGVNRLVFSTKRTELDVVVRDRIKDALQRDLPNERRKLPLVLVSSRLDPQKNHIGIVKAFAHSPELREKANLGIAVRTLEDPLHEYGTLTSSEKTVLDEIVSVINQEDLWSVVTSFSLNSQNELAAAFRVLAKRQSVFVLTSLYESFGLAPLEAMSCGLPVVVTRNGGPSESLLENGSKFGILVDPSDPQDIANGILKLVSSKQSWEHYSKAGLDRVLGSYTWDRTAHGYLSVIEGLVQRPDRHDPIEIPIWFTDPSPTNEFSLGVLTDL